MFTTNSESDNFLRVCEYPRNKREGFLADTVKRLGEGARERIAGDLSTVSKKDISNYAVANFNALDRYPNPRDQLISDSELVEALQQSMHRKEQAILVAMWLRFEEIKNTHVDATGMDVVYDTQLSYWDLVKYGEEQGQQYPGAQNSAGAQQSAETQYSACARNAELQQTEMQYAEAQMDQIFSQEKSSQSSPKESLSPKVTLHTIYGDNIISNYFD